MEAFWKGPGICARKLWFTFFKFLPMALKRNVGSKQDYTVMREQSTCPKFCKCQI